MEWGIAACLWLPPLAFGMDVLLADPRRIPHPVQAIGWLLNRMDALVRHKTGNSPERWHGVLCLLLLVAVVGCVVASGLTIPVLGSVWGLYASWSSLALGGLLRECRQAARIVAESDIVSGRNAVSMLVSRDLSHAERPDLFRALAETLSENFNDGFVAPYSWLLVGGPVGVWCYKAVSTVDSMWGYKTPRWSKLGWAGARLDDVLAYVPARLSAFFLWASWRWCGPAGDTRDAMSLGRVWHLVRTDAARMESPNAGWPMAMAAWLHGRSMGGVTWYFGQAKEKPYLGPRREEQVRESEYFAGGAWDANGLAQLLRHVRCAGILGAAALWLLAIAVYLLLS